MRLPRASGVLMHPTSLPSRHGIGDLGQEAHAFIQFLAESGQRWWQMLPVGPTGYGNSPYQSHSSFAGNKLLIDLDDLLAKGWLAPGTFEDEPRFPEDQVDFDAVGAFKERVLRLAHDGWKKQGDDPRYHEFVAANEVWLDDYVLYQALKDAHSGLPWYQWEHELVIREPAAMAAVARSPARRDQLSLVRAVRFRATVAGVAGGLPGARGDADRRRADLRGA